MFEEFLKLSLWNILSIKFLFLNDILNRDKITLIKNSLALSETLHTLRASHKLPSKSPDNKEQEWTNPDISAQNFKWAEKKKRLSLKSLL